METVKGIAVMLTAEDVAEVLRKPVRFVREKLLKTGSLPSVKLGGNSWRVDPDAFRAWQARGATGFRFAKGSGGARQRTGARGQRAERKAVEA